MRSHVIIRQVSIVLGRSISTQLARNRHASTQRLTPDRFSVKVCICISLLISSHADYSVLEEPDYCSLRQEEAAFFPLLEIVTKTETLSVMEL